MLLNVVLHSLKQRILTLGIFNVYLDIYMMYDCLHILKRFFKFIFKVNMLVFKFSEIVFLLIMFNMILCTN